MLGKHNEDEAIGKKEDIGKKGINKLKKNER